jgi:hypothetical protein
LNLWKSVFEFRVLPLEAKDKDHESNVDAIHYKYGKYGQSLAPDAGDCDVPFVRSVWMRQYALGRRSS